MKTGAVILLIAIIGLRLISCKTVPMNMEEFSYKQDITDSILIASVTTNPAKFVYGVMDSVVFKGEINQFNRAIDSLIKISSGSYKATYQQMSEVINSEIEKNDSVDLSTIKLTNLIIYPIHEMAQSGKLFVYDIETKTIQDSIWQKKFHGESLYQKKIRTRFYEGELFTTRTGKEFLHVELISGH